MSTKEILCNYLRWFVLILFFWRIAPSAWSMEHFESQLKLLTLDKTTPNHLHRVFYRLETLIDQHCDQANLAA